MRNRLKQELLTVEEFSIQDDGILFGMFNCYLRSDQSQIAGSNTKLLRRGQLSYDDLRKWDVPGRSLQDDMECNMQ